jgi:patatin-like phospholipase/acyl hydrolase
MAKKKKTKVLVIVGGGIYGCVPAQFLSYLPQEEQSLDKIDAIAGCSIGGILAAAYATGLDFTSVNTLFTKHADKCFVKRAIANVNPLACPTYSTEDIDKVLDYILGEHTLGETRDIYPTTDLIIPALNITDDKYKVFDNIDHQDDDIKLKYLAGITSAAPTYFEGREYKGKCLIDGGLIEVAPLITAVTTLKAKRNIPFKDMDVLMIGTGKDISDHPLSTEEYNELSLVGMALKVIVPYVTLSNELASTFWGNNMGFNSFTYFNPCTNDGDLANVEAIPNMHKQCDAHKDEFLKVWNKWIKK